MERRNAGNANKGGFVMADICKKSWWLLRSAVTVILLAVMMIDITFGFEEAKYKTNEFIGRFEKPTIDETITVSVSKVWVPATGHPESIKVQLYKNSMPEGSPITLDAGNNWSYEWTKLSNNDKWTVDEIDVAQEYSKTITGNAKDGFVITNTQQEEPQEKPEKPEKPDVLKPETEESTSEKPAPIIPQPQDQDDPSYNFDDGDTPRGGRDPEPDIPGGVPKTDDEANPRLWLIILTVSTLILRRELFFRKKEHIQEKK